MADKEPPNNTNVPSTPHPDDNNSVDNEPHTPIFTPKRSLKLNVRPPSKIVKLPGVGHHWDTLKKKRSLSQSGDGTHPDESPSKVQKSAASTTPRREANDNPSTPQNKTHHSPKRGKKQLSRDGRGKFVKQAHTQDESVESDIGSNSSDSFPDDPMTKISPFKSLNIDTILDSQPATPLPRRVESHDIVVPRQQNTEPSEIGNRRSSLPSTLQSVPLPQSTQSVIGEDSRAQEYTAEEAQVQPPPQLQSPPLKLFPRDYEIAPPRPLSEYSEDELRACANSFMANFTKAPSEIVWDIFKRALPIHLEVKQKHTGPDDATILSKPVLGVRNFFGNSRLFPEVLTNKCLVGLYPMITFDLSDPSSNWVSAQEYWFQRPTERILLELKGFDWCHIHALGNFVEFISQSKFLARHNKQKRIYPAHYRDLVNQREPEAEIIPDTPADKGEGAAAGEITKVMSNKEKVQKVKEKAEKEKEKEKHEEHVLFHIHNWDRDRHHPDDVHKFFGPDRDDELHDVVCKLIEMGTELRHSTKTKTRSTYTRAVYRWAVSKSPGDSLTDTRSKEICGRLLQSAQDMRADGSGFDRWYKRETRGVGNR